MYKSVAAVVVTFNRKELLVECIKSLQCQTQPLDCILIIDNASTDGTAEYLKSKNIFSSVTGSKNPNTKNPLNSYGVNEKPARKKREIRYYRLDENVGGAGGFYEGVKKAFELKYDWIWLMDDDAEPKNDALEMLLRSDSSDDISALACLKVSPENKPQTFHRGYFSFNGFSSRIINPIEERGIIGRQYLEIDHASFVGILIRRDAVAKIGYPKKEFFIHYDDVEYCVRLRSVGKILLVINSIIIHKEAGAMNRKMKKLLWLPYEIVPYEKLWLRYYHTRNMIWMKKNYSTKPLRLYLGLCFHVFGEIMGVLWYQDHKYKRIRFIFQRSIDGLRGTFDNNKPKMILYGAK